MASGKRRDEEKRDDEELRGTRGRTGTETKEEIIHPDRSSAMGGCDGLRVVSER